MPIVSCRPSFYTSTHGHSRSGAEGTIIEEPDNLPRMIWGLDTGEHNSDDFGTDSKMKKQEVSAQPPQHFRHSPRHYKPSDDNPAGFSTRPHSSTSTRAGPDSVSLGRLKPQVTSTGYTDGVYSPSPYSETIVLENLVERRNTRTVNQDHDYDTAVDLSRTLERNLRFREFENELPSSGELDRNLLSRTYGSRNSFSLSLAPLKLFRPHLVVRLQWNWLISTSNSSY